MKDRIFWKAIAVAIVLGLFAVAYELGRNSQVPSPSFVTAAYGAEAAGEKPKLEFEWLTVANWPSIRRAKVKGGWLVMTSGRAEAGITFYPDPKHEWDGGSLK